MDFLLEQTVHRKKSPNIYLKKLLLLTAAVFIPLICVVLGAVFEVYYFFVVAFFLVLVCIYGLWFFWTSLKIDYEYSMLNNTLSVSKIIANRNRKGIVKIDISSSIRLIKSENISELPKVGNLRRVYKACEDETGENLYAIVFDDKKTGGKGVLFFSPNEKILSRIKTLAAIRN